MSEVTTAAVEATPTIDAPTDVVTETAATVASEEAEYLEAMKGSGVKMMDEKDEKDTPDLDKMKADDEKPKEKKADKKEAEPKEKVEAKKDDKPAENEEPAKFSMKVKVDGEDREYTSEAEVKKLIQSGLSADKRFNEAAASRKSVDNLMQRLKNDPLSVLDSKELGIDFEKIAEDYLYKKIQFDSKTDVEKEAIRNKEELDKYKAIDAKRREEDERRDAAASQEKNRKEMSSKINTALETAGIPSNDWTIGRMAGYMRQALAKGITVEPSRLTELVKKDFGTFQQQFLGTISDPEDLISMIGNDAVDKIRKHKVAQYKQQQQTAKIVEGVEPREAKQKHYGSMEEMREAMMGR